MPRQHRGRRYAPPQWNHEEAQDALLAYMYGRLTAGEDAAVEAHIENCAWCRADGLRHIAAERHHLQQQRPKKPRRASRRAGMAVLCGIFGLLIAVAGFAGVMVMHPNLLLRAHGGQIPSPTLVPSATPTSAPTAIPSLTAQVSLPVANATALAWSPDGTTLALAGANGVARYTSDGHTWTATRCLGAAGGALPGTLAWSPDGTHLVGAGPTRLLIWAGTSCQLVATLTLPLNPATDLYNFDTVTGMVAQSAPATLFAPMGYLAWGATGRLQSASATTRGSFALWDGNSRLFTDDQGGSWLGLDDADQTAHAALLRWSPDGRYVLWGYPRVPLRLASGAATPLATALTAAVPATTKLIQTLATGHGTLASITLWLTFDRARLIVADATHSPVTWTCRDAQSGAVLATLSALGQPSPLRNSLDWRRDGAALARAAAAVQIFPAPQP
ncbi:MAG: zf-HC2 domain-containing protein [Ktedonobacterales bacterium]|nr:zf-HC2 domain-containing protein [Ktedonobacterales bacterium]